MSRQLSVGFLGFGEIGFALAKGLAAAGAGPLFGCDRQAVSGPLSSVLRSRAQEIGLTLSDDFAILAKADVVISAVVPFAAVDAARAFAPFARDGQYYLDVNSSAPSMKLEIADLLESTGACTVDASISGTGVHLNGHRGLTINLSGPRAAELKELLEPYDLNLKFIGPNIGSASALKMIRGVVMKGLEGLMVEMLLTADRYGVAEQVLDSVVAALDEESFADFGAFLVRSHMLHCGRRSQELQLIRDAVESSGVEPIMTDSALRFFRHSSELGLEQVLNGEVPKTWQEAIAVMNERLAPAGAAALSAA